MDVEGNHKKYSRINKINLIIITDERDVRLFCKKITIGTEQHLTIESMIKTYVNACMDIKQTYGEREGRKTILECKQNIYLNLFFLFILMCTK